MPEREKCQNCCFLEKTAGPEFMRPAGISGKNKIPAKKTTAENINICFLETIVISVMSVLLGDRQVGGDTGCLYGKIGAHTPCAGQGHFLFYQGELFFSAENLACIVRLRFQLSAINALFSFADCFKSF